MMEGKTQIIAHRGYWQTEPPTAENSLQLLENAQKLDIDGTEFDIRMSKDGVLIIYHDEHYESREISETQFSDLKKLKLKNDERIPTLKEYLEKGKEIPTLKLMLELKPLKSKVKESELVQKAIQLVNELHLGSQCEFISFSLNICEQLKKEKSTLKVHYLNGNLSPLEINEKGLDGLDYHYSIFLKNKTWISQAKNLGLTTNSWTINDLGVFNHLKEQGIDCITTDVPHLFLNNN